MTLVVLGAAILLLLLLIARFKLNAFLALVLACFFVGLANGMAPLATLQSVLKGIGDTMGSLALILVFGATLGKMIEESGAAHAISNALVTRLGESRVEVAVLVTGFLVGLPMIYNASFLVLIPLIYTLSVTRKLPLMALGIPLSSALSVTHGYLPPHPAPMAIAVMYHADVGRTLLYGLVLAVPATILAGPVLARFFKNVRTVPPANLYTPREFKTDELPGVALSVFTTLVPVLLMLAGTLVSMTGVEGRTAEMARFASDPTVALLVAILVSFYTLGLRRGRGLESMMKSVGVAVASVSMVLLIIAAGGAFKQVLLDAGTGEAIKSLASQVRISTILAAWLIAALLRLAVGSATVAAITAAGVVLPLIPGSGVAPELLVIATTSGSLMFSHMNDIGFWMFKEYYGMSIRQTFQMWTVMESIVAVVGLGGVFLLSTVVGPPPAAASSPRKVFYINSYHEGYPSSDEITTAIRSTLGARGVELRVFLLDAKRHPAPAEIEAKAREAVAAIRVFQPEVLIVSDDDAVKYVVVPSFKNGPLPVVFCGVNNSANQYGLPTEHVTGMLEVVPVEQTLNEVLSVAPKTHKLRVLSEDSTSEQSNTKLLDPRYRALGFEPTYSLVRDFAAWKAEFAKAQQESDVVYMPTNGAIRGWDAAEATRWVADRIRKPVVTCDDFMMPYAVFGLTKVAREQGEWAATAALSILDGKRPSQIPVVANQQVRCYWNQTLASRIAFPAPSGRPCEIYAALDRGSALR